MSRLLRAVHRKTEVSIQRASDAVLEGFKPYQMILGF